MRNDDDFRSTEDGIPSKAVTSKKKQGTLRLFENRTIFLMLAVYASTVVFLGIYYFMHENRRQNACSSFLYYQENYVEFLSDVDNYLILSQSWEFSSAVKPFTSKAALAIELSDPYGVDREASLLSEVVRSVAPENDHTDQGRWRRDVVLARERFVLAVQAANPCR